MSRISQWIIGLCILVWFVLVFGVCGALDCDTMTVGQAVTYIAPRTVLIVCIIGITTTADAWHKSNKKARQVRHPNRAD